MPKVDSKGRIVLPKELRERLRLDPGTEVDVVEEEGRVVVEPEDSPEDIIEDLERQINEATTGRERAPTDQRDPIARDHIETVQQGAHDTEDEITNE